MHNRAFVAAYADAWMSRGVLAPILRLMTAVIRTVRFGSRTIEDDPARPAIEGVIATPRSSVRFQSLLRLATNASLVGANASKPIELKASVSVGVSFAP